MPERRAKRRARRQESSRAPCSSPQLGCALGERRVEREHFSSCSSARHSWGYAEHVTRPPESSGRGYSRVQDARIAAAVMNRYLRRRRPGSASAARSFMFTASASSRAGIRDRSADRSPRAPIASSTNGHPTYLKSRASFTKTCRECSHHRIAKRRWASREASFDAGAQRYRSGCCRRGQQRAVATASVSTSG